MATYSSYKQITANEIVDGSLTDDSFAADAAKNFGVKWIYGSGGQCTLGCCCAWIVPAYVRKVSFELWGAGGNGHGACVNQRCQHYSAASGGSYNIKTVATAPGCTYSVNGYNLSNFCACGGIAGCANGDWNTACYGTLPFCNNAGDGGGDFYQTPMTTGWSTANVFCHCHNQETYPGSAVGIDTTVVQQMRECWMRCGCWTVPFGNGGQGAMSTYCGSGCCGQGGTGGSGLVKITYF